MVFKIIIPTSGSPNIANFDDIRNKNNDIEISDQNSKIKVYVIPTNEELEIAKQAFKLQV